MSEADEVNKPSWITANINIPTLMTLAALFFSGVTFYNQTNYRLDEEEASRAERARVIDDKFRDLNNQIASIGTQNIPYRVTVVEQQLTGLGRRLDEQLTLTAAQFEAIRKDLNVLSTRVEVMGANVQTLAQKVDALSGPTRKTEYEHTPFDEPPLLVTR